MKRVKIMLTVVIVLGAVGGVLAYKAKRIDPICTTATFNGTCPANTPCGGKVVGKITPTGLERCTTTPLANGNCPAVCPVFALTGPQN